jgi:hypothetical protein
MPYLCEPTCEIVDAARRETLALVGMEASQMLGEEARSDVARKFWVSQWREEWVIGFIRLSDNDHLVSFVTFIRTTMF